MCEQLGTLGRFYIWYLHWLVVQEHPVINIISGEFLNALPWLNTSYSSSEAGGITVYLSLKGLLLLLLLHYGKFFDLKPVPGFAPLWRIPCHLQTCPLILCPRGYYRYYTFIINLTLIEGAVSSCGAVYSDCQKILWLVITYKQIDVWKQLTIGYKTVRWITGIWANIFYYFTLLKSSSSYKSQ